MAAQPLSDLPSAPTDRPGPAPTMAESQASIQCAVDGLVAWVLSGQTLTFYAFKTQLVPKVLALGCLFIPLFLCMREAQWRAAHPQALTGYTRLGPVARQLGTFFGKVSYGRTYFYRKGGGYYFQR